MVGEWERRMSLSVKFFGDAAAVVREAYRLLNVWGKMGNGAKDQLGVKVAAVLREAYQLLVVGRNRAADELGLEMVAKVGQYYRLRYFFLKKIRNQRGG